jgi:hypothetical protein
MILQEHEKGVMLTNGVMASAIQRDLKLGSDSVRPADEDWISEPSLLEVERSSEASDDTIGSWSTSCLDSGLDGFDKSLSSVDRDTGRGVGEASLSGLGFGSSKGSVMRIEWAKSQLSIPLLG